MKKKVTEVMAQIEKSKNNELVAFQRVLDLLRKYENKKELTDEEIKEIQSLTCYDDIGFCCGIAKNCLFRDCTLQMLDISKEKYDKHKRDMTKKWLNKQR